MELAEFLKRESKIDEARILYKLVTRIQPYAYQGWLEHAKLEEEIGNTKKCGHILETGLKFNKLNESLFLKMIKVMEQNKDFKVLRENLGTLKDVPLE